MSEALAEALTPSKGNKYLNKNLKLVLSLFQ